VTVIDRSVPLLMARQWHDDLASCWPRDLLLRRSSAGSLWPARPQVIGYGGVSANYRESPALTDW